MASDDVELTSWTSDDEDEKPETHLLASSNAYAYSQPPSIWFSLKQALRRRRLFRREAGRASGLRQLWRMSIVLVIIWSIVLAYIGIFEAPYSKYPSWYAQDAAIARAEGAGNPRNEKVFIAANIINADLIRGAWGQSLRDLVYILGQDNVFVSIYENDSGQDTTAALADLRSSLSGGAGASQRTNNSIVSTQFPLTLVPAVKPSFLDHPVTKRVVYLAAVRNLAFLPLTSKHDPLPGIPAAAQTSTSSSDYHAVDVPPESFDKILFLNDVHFSPFEAVHLLFDTNKGDYAAACAVDYDNPVKFYDTFALRDTEGYSIGLPLFPLFTRGPSRQAMLAGSDAVPVKSCWGGMIAFEAKHFTRTLNPVRFRGESETDWEASECCLVNADIDEPDRTFMNPFIRVSYTPFTYRTLWLAARLEKVWVYPHKLISWAVGMPWYNPRQFEKEGDVIEGTGKKARKGGFCGFKALQVVEDTPTGRRWYRAKVP